MGREDDEQWVMEEKKVDESLSALDRAVADLKTAIKDARKGGSE